MEVPHDYMCPISMEIMLDPVILVETSITFERESIEQWFRTGKRTCPSTNKVLDSTHYIPNIALRNAIQEWAKEHSVGLPAPSPTSHPCTGGGSDSHHGSSAVAFPPLPGSMGELRQSAEQGNAGAQCLMGVCYGNGTGVGRNEARAAKWYRKAAEQGYAEAEFELGTCYLFGTGVGKNERRAVEWFCKAAEQGHASAQFSLSVCYVNGVPGVGKNETRAVEWFRKAAEQGHASAQCELGVCYLNGTGIGKDEACAVEWFRKAADQGHPSGQSNLGLCYREGEGVGKDDAQAVEWFRKAADQGHASAQFNLGSCYLEGRGVAREDARAVELFRQAAEQGNAYGQANLAEMLMEGRGCLENWAEASNLFESSVKIDCMQLQAKLTLAWLLWTGQGGRRVSRRRAKSLCKSVCSLEDYETRLDRDYRALGWTWPAVLVWFKERKWKVRMVWL